MDSDNEFFTFSSSLNSISSSSKGSQKLEFVTKSSEFSYQEEIQSLSIKLNKADGIIKGLIFSQEKIKQCLNQSRVENSNLILINRTLRKQLKELGAKVEENDKISKRLGKSEDVRKALEKSIVVKECEKCKSLNDKKYLNIEQMKGVGIKTKIKVNKGLSLWTVQLQSQIGVFVGIVKKPKEKPKLLKVSRTSNFSFRPQKPQKKVAFQGSFKIFPLKIEKIEKFQKLFQFDSQSFSFFPTNKVKKLHLKLVNCEKVNILRKKVKNTKEISKNIEIPEENQPSKPIKVPETLKMYAFPIFVNQCGRAQVEKLCSDDENDLDIPVPKRVFNLSISRTVKSAYVPKVKKLTIQKHAPIKLFPPVKLKHKAPILRFSKPFNTIAIKPQSKAINLQVFKVFKAKRTRQKIQFFESFHFCAKLGIQRSKGFGVVSETLSNGGDIEESVNGVQKRSRRTAKRASAIDEYFTLVYPI